jgi:hypothetical protein
MHALLESVLADIYMAVIHHCGCSNAYHMVALCSMLVLSCEFHRDESIIR